MSGCKGSKLSPIRSLMAVILLVTLFRGDLVRSTILIVLIGQGDTTNAHQTNHGGLRMTCFQSGDRFLA